MAELPIKLDCHGKIKACGRNSKNDVTVTIYNNSKGRHIGITFRNDVFKIFATDTDYFEYAIYKNRIYFRPSDDKHGILLCKNNNTSDAIRYARVMTENFVKLFVPFVGDYELKHDDFYDLYYVENSKMNK